MWHHRLINPLYDRQGLDPGGHTTPGYIGNRRRAPHVRPASLINNPLRDMPCTHADHRSVRHQPTDLISALHNR
ncbi:hypothetical protein JOF56_005215 [Kibdelosporangium banguiense]|uniref:Uncharacterized protein n=1 Tax=Kibdelosporangium banguiense TaxID=1365924 RepID=A0ABS4TLJ1_9PSEU|nr:hypothetical protein [Kibdelosporangium banguiense]MBP2324830.1 hypothetical protein [Kibdelosporangium banguiense]